MLFLGQLAVIWAHIERTLDLWIETIHAQGGSTLIQNFLPPNLDRELDYLSTSIKLGMSFEGVKGLEEGSWLIQEIHSLKNFRHNLIHGSVHFDDDGRLICHHTRVKRAGRIWMKTPYTKVQREKHYARTFALAERLDLFVFGPRKEAPETRR